MVIKKQHRNALLKSGYLPQSEAEQEMHKLGYGYDRTLSNMQTKVFVSPEGTPTIVHRGTTTAKDIIDDTLLSIGLGKAGYRFKNAARVTKKAEQKYGKSADAVGHSYGGWLGEHSNAHGEIVTYNKAAGLGGFAKQINPHQTDIRTKGDLASLISLTHRGGHKETIEPKHRSTGNSLIDAIRVHSLDNL